MTTTSVQIAVAATVSALFALAVYRLARSHLLSFRYAVGWLFLCALGVFSGIFAPLTEPIARAIGIYTGAFTILLGVILLISLCIQLSISISGIQQQMQTLIEKIAQIEFAVKSKEDDFRN